MLLNVNIKKLIMKLETWKMTVVLVWGLTTENKIKSQAMFV